MSDSGKFRVVKNVPNRRYRGDGKNNLSTPQKYLSWWSASSLSLPRASPRLGTHGGARVSTIGTTTVVDCVHGQRAQNRDRARSNVARGPRFPTLQQWGLSPRIGVRCFGEAFPEFGGVLGLTRDRPWLRQPGGACCLLHGLLCERSREAGTRKT